MNYLIIFFMIVFFVLYFYYYFIDNSYKTFEEMGVKTKSNYISIKQIKEKIEIIDNLDVKNKLNIAYKNRMKAWFCLFVNLFLFLLLIFLKR